MRSQIQTMLKQVIASIEFRQAWDLEHPNLVDNQRQMKLHFLDGKREALENVLRLTELIPIPQVKITPKQIEDQLEDTRRRIQHHQQKIDETEAKKAERLALALKGHRLKRGEDPDNWPIMSPFNTKIAGHQGVLDILKMDLKLLQDLKREAGSG